MEDTNVELSKNELELVTSSEFILTKNRIIEKVYNLFGLLSEIYKNEFKKQAAGLPAEAFASSPKIYKGENYLSLPYVMMDYPRVFLKDDVFAIRSFFWWGNYFSITLQLSGKYFELFKEAVQKNLPDLQEHNFFIGVNKSPWQHHFEATNYKLLKKIDRAEEILDKPFIKIAKQHSLHEWNKAAEFFEKTYEDFLKLIVW